MADEENIEQKESMSTTKLIIIITIIVVVISGGMAGVTIYLVGGNNAAQVAPADGAGEAGEAGEAGTAQPEVDKSEPAIYHRMDPKFVVAFSETTSGRFMQFTLQVMTRDDEVVSQLKEHDPAIRNNLLLLLDGKTADIMNTREGKEQLLIEITEDINKSLKELAGITGIEASYFYSFLLQ